MAYDNDNKPLIRARARKGRGNWRTTGVTAYQYVAERMPSMEGKVDPRAYITIKELTGQTELRLTWSQINALQELLTAVMSDASAARQRMIDRAEQQQEANSETN